MPQKNLTPQGQRRAMLRELGLEQSYLTYLRELGPEEARWHIEHEHAVMVDWLKRRTAYLLGEFAVERKPRPRRKTPNEPVEDDEPQEKVRFHRPTGTRYGQRVG